MFFLKLLMSFFLLFLAHFFSRLVVWGLLFSTSHGTSFYQQLNAFFWGLRFDFAATGIVFVLMLSVYLLFFFFFGFLRRKLELISFKLFITLSIVLIFIIHAGSYLYLLSSSRLLTYEIKDLDNSVFPLIQEGIKNYSLMVFGVLFLVFIVLFLGFKLFLMNQKKEQTFKKGKLKSSLQVSAYNVSVSGGFFLLFSVLAIRGFEGLPMSPNWGARLGHFELARIANNSVFSVFFYYFDLSEKELVQVQLSGFNRVEIQNTNVLPIKKEVLIEQLRHQNIVLVFLESWSAKKMQSYNPSLFQATPFFDEIQKTGLTTRLMIAGGSRTTEGMFSVLCSFQNPLGKTIARTHLQQNKVNCLPKILKDQGWSSAFFQGSNKDTSGVGTFALYLGFSESYGQEEIPSGEYSRSAWGYHDPDIYDFVFQKMDQMSEPFFVGINTNTTHNSDLPPQAKEKFGKLSLDNEINLLRFSDWALSDFYQKVKKKYPQTLFVFVSDHTRAMGKEGFLWQYAVPFSLVGPNIKPYFIDDVTSHRDIAPTVLDVLGIKIPEHFWGQSLLRSESRPRFADSYGSGTLVWYSGSMSYHIPLFNPQQTKCYEWKTDHYFKKEAPCLNSIEIDQALSFTESSQNKLFQNSVVID